MKRISKQSHHVLRAGCARFYLFLCLVLLSLISSCRRRQVSQPPLKVGIITDSGVEMVMIPAGWFKMGSSDGSREGGPAHMVWVDSFLMDRFEVDQSQYRMLEISSSSDSRKMNCPVDGQTWIEAARFCNLRSRWEGLQPCYDEVTWECDFKADGYRLPTEAEWEYACRAGSDMDYFFGNDPAQLKNYAWFKENSKEMIHGTGTREPNDWGLYDMYGNVAEWCHDYFDDAYYQSRSIKNPTGPEKGEERVIRGGAWNSSAAACRSAYRFGEAALDAAAGFRCVRKVKSVKRFDLSPSTPKASPYDPPILCRRYSGNQL